MSRFVLSSTEALSAEALGLMTPEALELTVEALATGGKRLRRSRAFDEHGGAEAEATVQRFTGPVGVTQWAVVYGDRAVQETTMHEEQEGAEAEYEELVRGLAEGSDAPWWDETDVPGLPLAPVTYTTEWQSADGVWHVEDESLPERLTEGEMATVHGAAHALRRRYSLYTDESNRTAALAAAVGDPAPGWVVVGRRVTVTGTGADGPVTHVAAAAFTPFQPTPQDITDYRRLLEQLDEEDRMQADEQMDAMGY